MRSSGDFHLNNIVTVKLKMRNNLIPERCHIQMVICRIGAGGATLQDWNCSRTRYLCIVYHMSHGQNHQRETVPNLGAHTPTLSYTSSRCDSGY